MNREERDRLCRHKFVSSRPQLGEEDWCDYVFAMPGETEMRPCGGSPMHKWHAADCGNCRDSGVMHDAIGAHACGFCDLGHEMKEFL